LRCPRCETENAAANRFCSDCGTRLTPPSPDERAAATQTLPPVQDLETGTIFTERYKIIEKLGAGGMGQVYKAYDTKVRDKIALKIIRPDIAADERTIERFRNELKLARQISHRNVCRMYDLGEGGGTHFITMEFVAGENLRNIMRMTRAMSLGTAVEYARQVCEGLAEAHRLGVVHRDLKPQNILIDEAGTAKIMDFGIARTAASEGLTGEGVMIGTPEYMSPEQAEGKPQDHRTDLYALGVILYEMVTGKRPFSGDTPISLAVKHRTEIPRPPFEWNAEIPVELNGIILRCLEKDPSRRFQTASDLAAALEAIQTALQPKETAIRTKTRRTAPAAGRRRTGWAIGIAAAVLVVGLAGVLFVSGGSDARALAVLPLEDLTVDKNQSVLCVGIADDIRGRLLDLKSLNLRVRLKESSDKWKDRSGDSVQFGGELKVRKILSGTLQVEKDVILVTVELSDVRRRSLLWTKKYPEKLDSPMQAAGRIADAVAKDLRMELGAPDLRVVTGRETSSSEAYVDYREGVAGATDYRNLLREEDFLAAVRAFRRSIDHDPGYCAPHWGLGDVYEARSVYSPDPSEQASMLALMEQEYRRAFEIDKVAPESLMRMGWIYFYREDFDHAYEYFRRAADRDPATPDVDFGIGSFLRSIGLYQNALKHYQRAIEQDPLAYRFYLTGVSCYSYTGEFKKALALAKRAADIEPSVPRTHTFFARQLLILKRYEAAEQELKRAVAIFPAERTIPRLKAWLAAARGNRTEALALIAAVKDPLYTYEITNAYCLLKMPDEAIRNIRTGIDVGFHTARDFLYSYPYLKSNPLFRVLEKDPRFVEILTAEKIKYEDKMRKYGDL
jgi:eukaryotic-like serine/threonine-protein kinase